VGAKLFSHSRSRNNAEAVALCGGLRGEAHAETFLDLEPEHCFASFLRGQEPPQVVGKRCRADRPLFKKSVKD
jgi:hypothetical protein